MNGYYPPPPYGYNYDPAGFQPSPSPAAQQNKKALRSLSIFAGIGLLGFMLMPVSYTHLDVYKRQ